MRGVWKSGTGPTETALGSNEASRVVRANRTGTLFVYISGTFSGQTVTMQFRPNGTASWITFAVDLDGSGTPVDQTWDGSGDVNPRAYKVSGMDFRFVVSSGGSPSIVPYVSGNNISVDDKT